MLWSRSGFNLIASSCCWRRSITSLLTSASLVVGALTGTDVVVLDVGFKDFRTLLASSIKSFIADSWLETEDESESLALLFPSTSAFICRGFGSSWKVGSCAAGLSTKFTGRWLLFGCSAPTCHSFLQWLPPGQTPSVSMWRLDCFMWHPDTEPLPPSQFGHPPVAKWGKVSPAVEWTVKSKKKVASLALLCYSCADGNPKHRLQHLLLPVLGHQPQHQLQPARRLNWSWYCSGLFHPNNM